MNAARQRYRFRLSLGMLFVLVTLFAVFLNWQLSIVRERQALLNALRLRGGIRVVPASLWAKDYPRGSQHVANLSPIRRLLGDEAIQEIWYDWNAVPPPAELARMKQVFPEAELRESLPEPCHPGCFPAGTMVETQEGPRRIETLGVGDMIKTFGPSPSLGKIQEVFVTDNRLWRIETESGELITTETQPLVLSDRSVSQVGHLQPGDRLLRFRDDRLRAVQVLRVERTDRKAKVYNLILGDSEFMLANGFLSRSKPPKESATQ
jgi:hypothetical protein